MSQSSLPGQGDKSNYIPSWLRQLGGWEETPEWLLSLIERTEGSLSAADLQEALAETTFEQPGEIAFARDQPEPDWFQGLETLSAEQAPPGAEETAPEETVEAMPDWLSGLEQEAPVAEAPAEEAVPDWLGGLEEEAPAAPAAEAPVEREAVPDWLGGMEQEAPAAPVAETPAEEEAVPDWLGRLEEEAPAAPAAEAPVEEEAVPDWLGRLEEEAPAAPAAEAPAEEEAVPDWLGRLEEAPAAPAAEAPVEEEAVPDWLSGLGEEAPVEEGVPDWLGRLEEEAPAAPAAEAPVEEEAIPDWLQEMEEGVPATPMTEAPTEEGIPDWLGRLEEEAPVEEGVPDWLGRLEEETPAAPAEEPVAATEGIPDWLMDLDEGVPTESSAEPSAVPPVEEEGVPEWLSGLGEEAPAEAVAEPPTTPSTEEEGTPDWLQSMGQVPTAEQPLRKAGTTDWLRSIEDMPLPAEIVPEETPTSEEHVPEWLQEVDLGETAPPTEALAAKESEMEIPDWLREAPLEETVETEQERETPPLQLPEQEVAAPTTPAWMQDMYTTEEETPPAELELDLLKGDELPTAETPAWIEELRAKEGKTPQEELPVETSGPLAGLRGLLNPEPLLGILPKSRYKPLPPTPESHQAEATLIEQALSAPPGRPVPVQRSPGQEVMASLGRWIIYSVLLTVIVVVAFMPALQDLIQPPEMPEVKAFYNVIEGLPAGSEVLLVLDYDASLDGELTPQTKAIIWHLLQKDLDIVTISLTPQGTAIVQDILQDPALGFPGERAINLGYLPPHPASLQAFISNPLGGTTLFGTTPDAEQTSLERRVRQFSDLDLIVTVSGTQDHIRWWIEQVGSQHPIGIIAGVSAAIAPYVQPYYSDTVAGQLQGMLVGLAGAAAYEDESGADFWPNARENFSLHGYAQIVLIVIVLLSGASSLTKRTARTGQAGRQKPSSTPPHKF